MPTAEDPQPRPETGREAGGKDPFADLVLDEEFVRGATVKEQSGRTRMLSARWKHTPPVDPGGRRSVNDGPSASKGRFGRKPKPAALDPWGNPRRPRRRGWRAPVLVVLTIAVVLSALNVDGLRTWFSDHVWKNSSAAPVPTVAPETARPTSAPPATPDDQPTVDHPWKGSPAEGWPNGPEAFVLPEAKAVGVFSADEVAAQLQSVKDYLMASNLDPRVIAGARPDAALAMLDRQERANAVTALDHPAKETDPTSWFTRFDPREAALVGTTVKVQGRISFEEDGDGGVLVHTDFTFVYPLQPGPDAEKLASSRRRTPDTAPGGTAKPVGLVTRAAATDNGDTWTTRTIVRKVDDVRFYDPKHYKVDAKKLVFAKTQWDAGNSACDVYDGFLHPQFQQFTSHDPAPTGPTTDPYDRNKDIAPADQCGSVSRT
ncbi:SCO2583/SCO2584 N-terminal domain-containing protein [Kitasatospora sp. NPDC054795]